MLHHPLSHRVKIGRTTSLRARVRGLEHANGLALTVVGTLEGDRELEFHAEFPPARCQHGVWFEPSPELRQWMRETFGYDLAPGPAVSAAWVAHALTQHTGLAFQEPDLSDLWAYLAEAFGVGGPYADDEVYAEDDEAGAEDRLNEALWPVLQKVEAQCRHGRLAMVRAAIASEEMRTRSRGGRGQPAERGVMVVGGGGVMDPKSLEPWTEDRGGLNFFRN